MAAWYAGLNTGFLNPAGHVDAKTRRPSPFFTGPAMVQHLLLNSGYLQATQHVLRRQHGDSGMNTSTRARL